MDWFILLRWGVEMNLSFQCFTAWHSPMTVVVWEFPKDFGYAIFIPIIIVHIKKDIRICEMSFIELASLLNTGKLLASWDEPTNVLLCSLWSTHDLPDLVAIVLPP